MPLSTSRLLAGACLLAAPLIAPLAQPMVAHAAASPNPAVTSRTEVGAAPRTGAPYADLVTLFTGWRAFEEPPRVNGAPDYSP
nr:hypothetical protein [Gemmatimonadaceae bacterium]